MGYFKMPKIKTSNRTPELNITKTYNEQHHQIKQITVFHDSLNTQDKILQLLEEQSKSSIRESRKNTAILILTALGVVMSGIGLILTAIL